MQLFSKNKSLFSEKQERKHRERLIEKLNFFIINWTPRFLECSHDEQDEADAKIAYNNLTDAKTYLEYMPYKADPQVKLYADKIALELISLENYHKNIVGKDKVVTSAETIKAAAIGWAKI